MESYFRTSMFPKMTREQFQNTHGPKWAVISSDPAFFAAMQLVSADKLKEISQLTDDQIKDHGHTILAGFRDRLQMEDALIDLAVASAPEPLDLASMEDYGASRSQEQQPAGEPVGNSPFTHFQTQPQ